MTQITPVTRTFETTKADGSPMQVKVTFNGKIYNGKRYINCQYRLNNTNSGLKSFTAIWQDGFGWIECRVWGNELVEQFGLE